MGSSQAPRFYLQVLTPVPQELLHPLAVEQGPGDLRGEEKAQNAEDGSADEDPGPEPARSVPPASRGGDETGPPGRRHPPERKTLLCISGRPRSRWDDLAPTARRRPGARDAPRCRVRHLLNLSLPVVSVSSPSVAALAARTLACCASYHTHLASRGRPRANISDGKLDEVRQTESDFKISLFPIRRQLRDN